jgi:hypothetical protein
MKTQPIKTCGIQQKTVLTEKHLALSTYIRKEEIPKINAKNSAY